MTSIGQINSLSLPARLFCCLGPLSAILLTSIASPRTGLLSSLAFAPTLYFFKKWRDANTVNPSRRAELESLIWTYAVTGTLGLVAVALLQMVVCTGASMILFPYASTRKEFWDEFGRGTVAGLTTDEVTRRAHIASSWQNWVFIGALSFAAAGLMEETLKYLPVAYARRRNTAGRRQPHDRAYLDYAMAGALSFGVTENIGFLYAACEKGQDTWSRFMLTLCERIVFGSSGHLLTSALTALRAIRRDHLGEHMSFLGVIGPSVLLHGVFDFVAMSSSAVEGNVGWIHPTDSKTMTVAFALLVSIVSTAAWQVWQNFKMLDEHDHRKR